MLNLSPQTSMSAGNPFSRVLSLRDKRRNPSKGRPDIANLFAIDEKAKKPSKDEEKKIQDIVQRLAALGVQDVPQQRIEYALRSRAAQGDSKEALRLLILYEDSVAGILKRYDPSVKMLGAENREKTTCYLDSLLFAMFAKPNIFEAVLFNTFEDEARKRLVVVMRLWVNLLRSGKLVTADIMVRLQESLAECGWADAAKIRQQDVSEAFAFITDKLDLPLLTLKTDIYHAGKEDAKDDHKYITERMLDVAIPEKVPAGMTLTLEMCLEDYFNNRVEVKRHLQRRGTLEQVNSAEARKGSVDKAGALYIETVELDSRGNSPAPGDQPVKSATLQRPLHMRNRATSIFSERKTISGDDKQSAKNGSSEDSTGRPRANSSRKEVLMPAWQFLNLIPWYTDTAIPQSDAQVSAHFRAKRPMLGICLKRYAVTAKGVSHRLNTHIDIPLEMAIPHFDSSDGENENPPTNNFKLVLQSAVCHRGQYVDSGHYVSLVRTGSPENAAEQGDDEHAEQNHDTWVIFDDLAYERVRKVDIRRALSEESPYLLFYKVQPLDEPDSAPLPPYEQSEDSFDMVDEKLSNLSNTSARRSRESIEAIDSRRPSTDGTSPEDPRGRTSLSSARRSSLQWQGWRGTSTNGSIRTDQASPEPVTPYEDTTRTNSATLSRQSTRAKNGVPEAGNDKRFAMSMSRITSKLNRDKVAYPEIVVDEVHEVMTVEPVHKEEHIEEQKPKTKEKKKKFGTSSRRGSGGQKGGKQPDRDCIIMIKQVAGFGKVNEGETDGDGPIPIELYRESTWTRPPDTKKCQFANATLLQTQTCRPEMLNAVCCQYLLTAVCFSSWACLCNSEPVRRSATSVGVSSFSLSTGVCPSTSINYITHGLLQQCLRPDRPAITSSTYPVSLEPSTVTLSTSEHGLVTASVIETASSISTLHPASVTTSLNISNAQPSSISISEALTSTSETFTTSATLASTTVVAISPSELDNETDSLLDDAKFLSFEEWKKENLAKGGQSAEGLSQERRLPGSSQDSKEHGINHGLDTLGDDSEIELNFGGFGAPPKPVGDTSHKKASITASRSAGETGSSSLRSRSKDAGKTYKERSNYASVDCAADVVKTNSRCKGSLRILSENKDSYMLNECKMEGKFIIVELCDHILVDTIVLANFEFFSSMFRRFRVSVSDRYPIKTEKWKELGTYEARNSREIQAFLVENPLIWARYLKIEFLTHYGSEFYCPVSLLRVHGTTMMDEYRREELGTAEGDDEDEGMDELVDTSPHSNETLEPETRSVGTVELSSKTIQHEGLEQDYSSPSQATGTITTPATSISKVPDITPVLHVEHTNINSSSTTQLVRTLAYSETSTTEAPALSANSSTTTRISTDNSTIKATVTTSSKPHNTTTATSQSVASNSTHITKPPSNLNSSQSSPTETPTTKAPQTSSITTSLPATSNGGGSSPSPSIAHHPHSSPAPPTQESFFKSINKRLQALEANATLSLQYIEAQSQLLRDAFSKVEKRQLAKTTTFLETLNATVTAELAKFKSDYEQLWQSTVLELAAQREEGKRESEILGERVRMLAEEMVGQKRIMAAQAMALLFCAGLLIFTRVSGGHNGHHGNGDAAFLHSGTQSPTRNDAKTRKPSNFSFVGNGNGTPTAEKSPNTAAAAATRRRWRWDSPWSRSPAGTPRSGAVRSDGEDDEEELEAVMGRLSVSGGGGSGAGLASSGLETPTASSPGIASPMNGGPSEDEEEEEEQTGEEVEGLDGEGEGQDIDTDADADPQADTEDEEQEPVLTTQTQTQTQTQQRPGMPGVQSAPTVPVLGGIENEIVDDRGGESA